MEAHMHLISISRPAIRLAKSVGTFIAAFLLTGHLAAADNADPLATLRKEHPRLLFTAEDQKRVVILAETEPLLARLIEQNRVNAIAMLSEAPMKSSSTTQSRKSIERVVALAMAYRLSGDHKFSDAAIREMLVIANFEKFSSHFLVTAETTTALAIGYDWLYDQIPPDDRRTIREAITQMGLQPGMKSYEKKAFWVRRSSNWNKVCNGGMILGALAIAEDEKELARNILVAALKSIPNGVKQVAPDGASPEGPQYWQYGMSYTALTFMGLNSALGTDFGFSKSPGLDKSGLFRIHTVSPTGLYFNYADSGTRYGPASVMFALSRTYDRSLFAWWHREQLNRQVPMKGKITPQRLDRLFPLEVAWYDPRGIKPTLEQLPREARFHGVQDIVAMRSRWDDPDAVFVGFKGGQNGTGHGHLDIGSFVLDAEGVRWAVDLGKDAYNLRGYFNKDLRWTYYRMNNRSHNTLVIGDQLHNTTAVAKVVDFGATLNRAHATVNMTDAYKGQATSATRTIELLNRRTVRVVDKITDPSGEVRWGMVTEADITLDGNKATLSQQGKQLTVEIASPPEAKFEVLSTKPPSSGERQNQGTRMLAARLNPAKGEMKIEVLLVPQTTRNPDFGK